MRFWIKTKRGPVEVSGQKIEQLRRDGELADHTPCLSIDGGASWRTYDEVFNPPPPFAAPSGPIASSLSGDVRRPAFEGIEVAYVPPSVEETTAGKKTSGRKWILLILALAVIATGAWWFFFREEDLESRCREFIADKKLASPTYSGPPVSLEPKFAPGKYIFTEEQTNHTESKSGLQTVMNREVLTMVGDYVISEPTADGRQVIVYTCRKVRSSQNANGVTQSYDSEDNYSPENNLKKIYGNMIGWKMTIFSQNGKAVSVEGIDNLMDRITDSMPEIRPMIGPMKKKFKGMFKEALTQNWGKFIPSKPVSPGEQWEREIQMNHIPFFGGIHFKGFASLRDVVQTPDGPEAILDFAFYGVIKDETLNSDEMPLPPGFSIRADHMTMLATGTSRINLSSGMSSQVNMDVRVEGEMTVENGAQKESVKVKTNVEMKQTLTKKPSSPAGG